MKEIVDGDYEKHIKNGIVILEVCGSNCGVCKHMTSVIDKIESAEIVVMNVNEGEMGKNMFSALRLGVNSIPAFFVYKNGILASRWTGYKTVGQVEEILSGIL